MPEFQLAAAGGGFRGMTMAVQGQSASAVTIKGNVLIARMKYIRERAGEDALKKILARLSPEHREVLTGMLLPVSWYPLGLALALDEAIAAELSPHNRDQIFVEMGRNSAETNLSGAEKAFIRPGDPHFVLRMAPQIYGFYYHVGRRTYERTGPEAAVLRTFDAESVTAADCLTVMGWHQRALELSGAKQVTMKHPVCRARGGAHCEYHFTWATVA